MELVSGGATLPGLPALRNLAGPDRVAPFVEEMSRFLGEFKHSWDYDGYLYAMSQLLGPARVAIENRARGMPAGTLSWDLMSHWLLAEFQSPAVQHLARRELRNLRQTGSLYDYTGTFRSIEYKLPDMSDIDKQFSYREGLTDALANGLAQYSDFRSLQELIAFTARLDAQLRASGRSAFASSSAFQANSEGPQCHFCKRKGHYKNECPELRDDKQKRHGSPTVRYGERSARFSARPAGKGSPFPNRPSPGRDRSPGRRIQHSFRPGRYRAGVSALAADESDDPAHAAEDDGETSDTAEDVCTAHLGNSRA